MANKKSNAGKVIGHVNGFTLRRKDTVSGNDKDAKITGTTIGIYRGKKLVEGNFNNKERATKRANELNIPKVVKLTNTGKEKV
tara:strand:+ start:2977 stop:3225 length:249 start_codon:yes stop_codon:yes gene_type:complete